MRYSSIGKYLEETFGITEFWINNLRIIKTSAGSWIPVK